jgi:hypothetical protein
MTLMYNPQISPTPASPVTDREVIADLQRTIAQLEARLAELELPPAEWLPLKAAAHDCGAEYENTRKWAVRGLIEARREGGRWFVNVVSLRARLTALGIPHRERKQADWI